MNNWIDRRAEKQQAIEGGGRDLWQNFGVAIQEICESFNTHYGREYSKVKAQPENGNRIRVIRQIVRTMGPGHVRPEDVSLQVIYEPKQYRITATCATNDVKIEGSVDIEFNPEEYARPFLSKSGRRISDDEASEILLKDFLFHDRFSQRE